VFFVVKRLAPIALLAGCVASDEAGPPRAVDAAAPAPTPPVDGAAPAPVAQPAAQAGAESAESEAARAARLRDAEKWLSSAVCEEPFLSVAFEGEPLDVRPPAALEFAEGSGHGGSLAFVRLDVAATTTRCERVTWQAYRRDSGEPAGTASRAEVSTDSLLPLIDTVRALSRAKVVNVSENRHWTTSNDFFVLTRVCGAADRPDRTWEFAGYSSSDTRAQSAAISAVLRRARETFDAIAWRPIAPDEYRRTHFPDTFARNRDLIVEPFHWWVMERSVEALGWFGDKSVLATVAWTREHAPELLPRQVAKLQHILDEPDLYLDGPPREVPDE
jgi:hypothetical protein